MDIKIQRALLSVYDKAGIIDFAHNLSEMGVEILSTGGTATAIRDFIQTFFITITSNNL